MLIKNGNVITPGKLLHDTDVLICDGKIEEIGTNLTSDGDIFDASGCYVSPGLIDIHTHGGGGGDFMDAEDSAFENALRFHSKNGTTSVLTASVTAPVNQIETMLGITRRYMKDENPVCRVLGAYVEGPYISFKNKGAHKDIFLRVPEDDDYSFILNNRDVVRSVTISPELRGAEKMARDLAEAGITVSCGHDDGKKENIEPVIEAGMTNCTHWYCAMSTAQVREGVRSVGLMELSLLDDRLSLELLADNHHLTPELVKLAYRCKGAKKLCLVSDCLRAGGKPADGTIYTVGPADDEDAQKFIVSDGVARLTDGTRFAGSIQPVGQMVRNLVNDCNIPLLDAVRMASLTPAEIIGVDKCVGSIEKGKYGDIFIMDSTLHAVKTIVNGNIIE